MKPDRIVSAQVVLAAASGARPGPTTRITSENVREWAPSAETVASVSTRLHAMGFATGEFVGNSLSITGPVRLFESSFHTKLREVSGAVEFSGGGAELPAAQLPTDLRAHVVAVTFTRPPDFGPGSSSFS